jgi:hypothetical protein
VKLHPSRVIKLIGLDIGDTQIDLVWGDPVLQAINDAIKACGLVSGSLATLISEMKVDIIKIPNLTNILSTDAGTRKVVGRFQAANAAKSVINTIMIDSNEEWTRIQQSLNGMDGLIATYLQIVSGAVDIPAGRFLGLPHKGLNVTGEADFRNYYDRLASEQTVTLTPAMNILDEVLIRSALGERPDNVRYEWNSLWQLSDDEKATVALKKAQAYQVDVASAQLPATALANARANQLIEDDFYPGLEQALEDAAAEGDTIEEQNAPAPPPTLPPAGGVPPQLTPPTGGAQPPPPTGGAPPPVQPGQTPPAATGDSAFEDRRLAGLDPDSSLQDWINAAIEDYNECHAEHSGEFCATGGGGGGKKEEAKKAAAKPAPKKKRAGGGGGGHGGGGGGGGHGKKAGAEQHVGAKGELGATKEQSKEEKETAKTVGEHEKEQAHHEKEQAKAEKTQAHEEAKKEKETAAAEKKSEAAAAKAGKAQAAAEKKGAAQAAKAAKAEEHAAKQQAAGEAKAHKQALKEEQQAQKAAAQQEKAASKGSGKSGKKK